MSHKRITKELKSHYKRYKSNSFFKSCVLFGNECMSEEPGIIFYSCNVMVKNLQKTPPNNIKQFENYNPFFETILGKLTEGTQFSDFSEIACAQTP